MGTYTGSNSYSLPTPPNANAVYVIKCNASGTYLNWNAAICNPTSYANSVILNGGNLYISGLFSVSSSSTLYINGSYAGTIGVGTISGSYANIVVKLSSTTLSQYYLLNTATTGFTKYLVNINSVNICTVNLCGSTSNTIYSSLQIAPSSKNTLILYGSNWY